MQTVTKALVGSAVAGAMALTAATPAAAQYRERDRGIDAGDVIAGALIIAAMATIMIASMTTGTTAVTIAGMTTASAQFSFAPPPSSAMCAAMAIATPM